MAAHNAYVSVIPTAPSPTQYPRNAATESGYLSASPLAAPTRLIVNLPRLAMLIVAETAAAQPITSARLTGSANHFLKLSLHVEESLASHMCTPREHMVRHQYTIDLPTRV